MFACEQFLCYFFFFPITLNISQVKDSAFSTSIIKDSIYLKDKNSNFMIFDCSENYLLYSIISVEVPET